MIFCYTVVIKNALVNMNPSTGKDWNRKKVCRVSLPPHMPKVLDTIIIGAGPAGMTAAVYAARRGMSTLLLSGKTGGQLQWSTDIQNWTGTVRSTGPVLAGQMMCHVEIYAMDRAQYRLVVQNESYAEQIAEKPDGGYRITTRTGDRFDAHTVIITCGKRPRMLGIIGEKEAQKGAGLSFSATSDAPLYRSKKVVVIGGGNSGMEVALQLTKVTNEITIITNISTLKGVDCVQEQVRRHEAISVIYDALVEEIYLSDRPWVRGVRYKTKDGETYELPCEGIFESIGMTPNTAWLSGFLMTDDQNQIIINRDCETSQSGVFAGGDCCDNVYKQVAIATGQGAICALRAHDYLTERGLLA